jgi:hypothetical protein
VEELMFSTKYPPCFVDSPPTVEVYTLKDCSFLEDDYSFLAAEDKNNFTIKTFYKRKFICPHHDTFYLYVDYHDSSQEIKCQIKCPQCKDDNFEDEMIPLTKVDTHPLLIEVDNPIILVDEML